MGGLTSLVLLLCAGVPVSAKLDQSKSIKGGKTCGKDERHYHVYLQEHNGTHYSGSGGSLISNKWVLTSARCLDAMTAYLNVHPDPKKYTEIELKDRVIYHKDRYHDIMLLQLSDPAPATITPVQLPDCDKSPDKDDVLQVAGYGPTAPSTNKKNTEGSLKMLPDYQRFCKHVWIHLINTYRQTDIISITLNGKVPADSTSLKCENIKPADCETFLAAVKDKLNEMDHQNYKKHLFCGQAPGEDFCLGDTGGGVVFNNMIYGLHVLTGDLSHACDKRAGFLNVCDYLDWITETAGVKP